MLKPLFNGLMIVSDAYYGDSIGLAPISLSMANTSCTMEKKQTKKTFWDKECAEHPSSPACLLFDD